MGVWIWTGVALLVLESTDKIKSIAVLPIQIEKGDRTDRSAADALICSALNELTSSPALSGCDSSRRDRVSSKTAKRCRAPPALRR